MSSDALEKRVEYLESEIEKVQQRNLRVQSDKAWETSKFRVLSICVLTWVTISLVFWLIGVTNYFISAIIPVLGFFLSTQSLPFLKKWWINRHFGKS